MKLRIVREDGTPATVDDFLVAEPVIFEMEGVPMALIQASGPSGTSEPWSEVDDVGRLELVMEYANHKRAVVDRERSRPGETYSKAEWDCPFARLRRERAAAAAKPRPASKLRTQRTVRRSR